MLHDTRARTKEKAGRMPGFVNSCQERRVRARPRCNLYKLFRDRAFDGFGIRPPHKLDQGHRRRVARPKAELQDAQVAARTRLIARAKFVEELGHDVAIAQAIERNPAI